MPKIVASGREVIVDEEDFTYTSSYEWYVQEKSGKYYVLRSQWLPEERYSITVRLSRVLACAVPGDVVRYKNGNGLDNRKSNLILKRRQR